jgi:hypothetical protein
VLAVLFLLMYTMAATPTPGTYAQNPSYVVDLQSATMDWNQDRIVFTYSHSNLFAQPEVWVEAAIADYATCGSVSANGVVSTSPLQVGTITKGTSQITVDVGIRYQFLEGSPYWVVPNMNSSGATGNVAAGTEATIRFCMQLMAHYGSVLMNQKDVQFSSQPFALTADFTTGAVAVPAPTTKTNAPAVTPAPVRAIPAIGTPSATQTQAPIRGTANTPQPMTPTNNGAPMGSISNNNNNSGGSVPNNNNNNSGGSVPTSNNNNNNGGGNPAQGSPPSGSINNSGGTPQNNGNGGGVGSNPPSMQQPHPTNGNTGSTGTATQQPTRTTGVANGGSSGTGIDPGSVTHQPNPSSAGGSVGGAHPTTQQPTNGPVGIDTSSTSTPTPDQNQTDNSLGIDTSTPLSNNPIEVGNSTDSTNSAVTNDNNGSGSSSQQPGTSGSASGGDATGSNENNSNSGSSNGSAGSPLQQGSFAPAPGSNSPLIRPPPNIEECAREDTITNEFLLWLPDNPSIPSKRCVYSHEPLTVEQFKDRFWSMFNQECR